MLDDDVLDLVGEMTLSGGSIQKLSTYNLVLDMRLIGQLNGLILRLVVASALVYDGPVLSVITVRSGQDHGVASAGVDELHRDHR